MSDLQILQMPILTSERTMEIILDALGALVPYELAVILRLEEGGRLRVHRARGPLYTSKLRDYAIPLDKRPDLAEILEKGEVRLLSEHGDDPEHQDTYADVMQLPADHSCLVAPLHVEGRTIGMLTLDHRTCDMFSPQVVEITRALARIVALALAQSLATETLLSEREALVFERNTLLSELTPGLENLIGRSPAWLSVLEAVRIVASTDTPVLIQGETGTGKELAARAVHALSPRMNRPFVALNCSAIVDTLAESELFGHERGAFTGAAARRLGRFELANNGTLFLDEIGDLPLTIQPKLLRALQEGSFERVGGEKTIQADVRIVCASNVNLAEAVQKGKFREDLFYRLNVFPIHLPPLRERGDDILLLAEYFLRKLAEKYQQSPYQLTPEAVQYLTEYHWPGNVRELQNVLEGAAILARQGVITVEHLQRRFPVQRRQDKSAPTPSTEISTLEEATRQHIERALRLCQGRIYGPEGAAQLLGLKPSTLQSKIKKLGIAKPGRA